MRRMISMACVKKEYWSWIISRVEHGDIDGFHIDILSQYEIDTIQESILNIKKQSCKLLEIHFLDEKVDIDKYLGYMPDILYVSSQCENFIELHKKISDNKTEVGVYFDCNNEIGDNIEPYLNMGIKKIMILSVQRGRIGGEWLQYAECNIKKLLSLKQKYEIEIELDGGCSPEIISKYSEMGVDAFVLGTKSGYLSVNEKVINN